ncbi:hypothetical protein L596_011095 [Steinernema carpocapsae]|uniref:Uncharacterized protein n=1 Tax=Steinernema carpocapsae TaxID=34508 RepID=A0A4U5NTP4_STECR|nr:hypothetical protein L596_011095 [Steinernema carpocapsae]
MALEPTTAATATETARADSARLARVSGGPAGDRHQSSSIRPSARFDQILPTAFIGQTHSLSSSLISCLPAARPSTIRLFTPLFLQSFGSFNRLAKTEISFLQIPASVHPM